MEQQNPGSLLAQANVEVGILSKSEGIKGIPEKTPIIAMIIQNLHEALLAYDQKIDISGKTVDSAQIAAGIKNMLNYLIDKGLWAKLQQDTTVELNNKIVRLTGLLRACANALLNEKQ